jgi:hypothetical protein
MGPSLETIQKFWLWFSEHRSEFARLLDSREASRLAKLINTKLELLYPDLQWEMGPGINKEFQFVISPGGKLDLRPMIRNIIDLAPQLPDWEFYPSRQACPTRLSITLPESRQSINAEHWTCDMRLNPISGKIDVVLFDASLAGMEPKSQLRIGLLILDSLLGEDLIEDWLGEVEFSSTRGPRPIQDLTRYVRSIAAHH